MRVMIIHPTWRKPHAQQPSSTHDHTLNQDPWFEYHRFGADRQYCGDGYSRAIVAARKAPDTQAKGKDECTAHADRNAMGTQRIAVQRLR